VSDVQGLEFTDQLSGPAELQIGLDAVHPGEHLQLVQARDLDLGEVLVGEIRQRGSPPHRERSAQPSGGCRRIVSHQRSTCGHLGFEAVGIDVGGVDLQGVPVIVGHDQVGVAECGTQP
jgi:hypothetical protein